MTLTLIVTAMGLLGPWLISEIVWVIEQNRPNAVHQVTYAALGLTSAYFARSEVVAAMFHFPTWWPSTHAATLEMKSTAIFSGYRPVGTRNTNRATSPNMWSMIPCGWNLCWPIRCTALSPP